MNKFGNNFGNNLSNLNTNNLNTNNLNTNNLNNNLNSINQNQQALMDCYNQNQQENAIDISVPSVQDNKEI